MPNQKTARAHAWIAISAAGDYVILPSSLPRIVVILLNRSGCSKRSRKSVSEPCWTSSPACLPVADPYQRFPRYSLPFDGRGQWTHHESSKSPVPKYVQSLPDKICSLLLDIARNTGIARFQRRVNCLSLSSAGQRDIDSTRFHLTCTARCMPCCQPNDGQSLSHGPVVPDRTRNYQE
jgi:hypothetical protein